MSFEQAAGCPVSCLSCGLVQAAFLAGLAFAVRLARAFLLTLAWVFALAFAGAAAGAADGAAEGAAAGAPVWADAGVEITARGIARTRALAMMDRNFFMMTPMD